MLAVDEFVGVLIATVVVGDIDVVLVLVMDIDVVRVSLEVDERVKEGDPLALGETVSDLEGDIEKLTDAV